MPACGTRSPIEPKRSPPQCSPLSPRAAERCAALVGNPVVFFRHTSRASCARDPLSARADYIQRAALIELALETARANSVGVPEEGIGIILGVDRLLDMCRTTLNVTGDLAVAVCVDSGEVTRSVSEGERSS